jgi:hypothetical protein
LRQLQGLLCLAREIGVGVEKTWLKVSEVAARLREAGYTDSLDTIRRGVDRGHYGDKGTGWYVTDTGYRMVSSAAVDALISRRSSPAD